MSAVVVKTKMMSRSKKPRKSQRKKIQITLTPITSLTVIQKMKVKKNPTLNHLIYMVQQTTIWRFAYNFVQQCYSAYFSQQVLQQHLYGTYSSCRQTNRNFSLQFSAPCQSTKARLEFGSTFQSFLHILQFYLTLELWHFSVTSN